MNKIHPFTVIHEDAEIGQNVTIWQFAAVLKGAKIGNNVSIGMCAEIGAGSEVGEGTRISRNVFFPSNSKVGKNCFFGPHCCFADDRYPVANNPSYLAEPPIIEDDVSVGMNATILPGVRLGKGCRVGAGAIVTRNVLPGQHVRGEPARAKAYSGIHHQEFHELAVPSALVADKNDSHLQPV